MNLNDVGMVDMALVTAEDGDPVFPLRPNKSPYSSKGFKNATRDPAIIRSMWAQHPDANIGIALQRWDATGSPDPDGDVVEVLIDVDLRSGGDRSMQSLIEKHGKLPETRWVRTGGGGWHFLFVLTSIDPKRIRDNVAGHPGIDVKLGGKGYRVGPGSLHESGERYVDMSGPVRRAPLPPWLLDYILKPEPNSSAPQTNWRTGTTDIGQPWVRKAVDEELRHLATCPESGGRWGGRNRELNNVAFNLAQYRGVDRRWLERQLIAACKSNGLASDMREVAKTISSAFSAADREPPRRVPEPDRSAPLTQIDENELTRGDRVDLLANMYSGAWLDRQIFAPLEYVVPGVIPEGASLLSAPPKVGKSWLVLDMGLQVASGGEFLGQSVDQRPVLYLALEDGHRRIQERARTLLRGRPIPSAFHYMLVVDSQVALATVLEFLDRHPDDRPLVIVDTLGRIKPQKKGGDESYLADYHFAANLKAAIDTRPGAALVCVHHTRKAQADDFVEAGSGTLGLAGAFDTVLVIKRKRHEQTGTLFVTGRDVEEGRYALRVDDGHWSIDGPTLIDAAGAAEDQASADRAGRYSGRTQQVLKIVQDRAAAGQGTTPQDIAQQTGLEVHRFKMTLKRLCDSGDIERLASGVYTVTRSASVTCVTECDSAGQSDFGGHTSQSKCDFVTSSARKESHKSHSPSTSVTAKTAPELQGHTSHTSHTNRLKDFPVPLVTGPGRCGSCGFHIETQGHRANCPERKEAS